MQTDQHWHLSGIGHSWIACITLQAQDLNLIGSPERGAWSQLERLMSTHMRYADIPMTRHAPRDQMTDAQLVSACRDGSELAWGEFVNRFGRLIYAAARRRGLSDADAEEVLQRTFEAAWKHINQLRDSQAVRGWLLTTAMRQCWRVGRAAAKTPVFIESIDEPSEEDTDRLQQLERQDLVRRALSLLGDPCKTLLIAIFRRGQGDRYAEVAEQLGIPVGSIGPTRGRCFRKLEDILGRLGFTP